MNDILGPQNWSLMALDLIFFSKVGCMSCRCIRSDHTIFQAHKELTLMWYKSGESSAGWARLKSWTLSHFQLWTANLRSYSNLYSYSASRESWETWRVETHFVFKQQLSVFCTIFLCYSKIVWPHWFVFLWKFISFFCAFFEPIFKCFFPSIQFASFWGNVFFGHYLVIAGAIQVRTALSPNDFLS